MPEDRCEGANSEQTLSREADMKILPSSTGHVTTETEPEFVASIACLSIRYELFI